jgi:TonB family protein
MKFILTTFFSLFTLSVFSQDRTYYTKAETKTTFKDSAEYYWVDFINPTDSNQVTSKKYLRNGKIVAEQSYSDYKKSVLNGKVRKYSLNGILLSDIDYKKNKIDGKLLTYWSNGKLKRSDIYKQDSLIEGRCFTAEGKDTAYFPYYLYPQFLGGMDSLKAYLKNNLRYPPDARKNGNEGTVYVSFVVDLDGTITNISLQRSISPELNAEAIRVVSKMPNWLPGNLDGKYLRFRYTLPITFRLPD